ncbi:MAG: hypothetical protein Q7S00_07145 [bacterium]|nr:hypothetical protein [bacterium]
MREHIPEEDKPQVDSLVDQLARLGGEPDGLFLIYDPESLFAISKYGGISLLPRIHLYEGLVENYLPGQEASVKVALRDILLDLMPDPLGISLEDASRLYPEEGKEWTPIVVSKTVDGALLCEAVTPPVFINSEPFEPNPVHQALEDAGYIYYNASGEPPLLKPDSVQGWEELEKMGMIALEAAEQNRFLAGESIRGIRVPTPFSLEAGSPVPNFSMTQGSSITPHAFLWRLIERVGFPPHGVYGDAVNKFFPILTHVGFLTGGDPIEIDRLPEDVPEMLSYLPILRALTLFYSMEPPAVQENFFKRLDGSPHYYDPDVAESRIIQPLKDFLGFGERDLSTLSSGEIIERLKEIESARQVFERSVESILRPDAPLEAILDSPERYFPSQPGQEPVSDEAIRSGLVLALVAQGERLVPRLLQILSNGESSQATMTVQWVLSLLVRNDSLRPEIVAGFVRQEATLPAVNLLIEVLLRQQDTDPATDQARGTLVDVALTRGPDDNQIKVSAREGLIRIDATVPKKKREGGSGGSSPAAGSSGGATPAPTNGSGSSSVALPFEIGTLPEELAPSVDRAFMLQLMMEAGPQDGFVPLDAGMDLYRTEQSPGRGPLEARSFEGLRLLPTPR